MDYWSFGLLAISKLISGNTLLSFLQMTSPLLVYIFWIYYPIFIGFTMLGIFCLGVQLKPPTTNPRSAPEYSLV